MNSIYTIGYSGLKQEEFIQLLISNECKVVCDVRSYPYSRYRPEFSRREFKQSLNSSGLKYTFFGDALGARPKDRACYRNGVAEYDLISRQKSFRDALLRLVNGSKTHKLALVCSESDPIECHRAILVAKHLAEMDSDVRHIHIDGVLESHVELEDRLVELYGTAPPPLLRTELERTVGVENAYERQAQAICFTEKTEWKKDEAVHNRFH